jgi:uncharacterized protein with von Willebrand factor type A (vWA) domain
MTGYKHRRSLCNNPVFTVQRQKLEVFLDISGSIKAYVEHINATLNSLAAMDIIQLPAAYYPNFIFPQSLFDRHILTTDPVRKFLSLGL